MSGKQDPQRLYLHVGMPKTGTTYLQTVFFSSRTVLEERGLALVPRKRKGHFALVLAVQGRGRPTDGPLVTEAPQRWAQQLAELEAPIGLFSHETMGSSYRSQIDRLVEGVPDHLEVHVVITVRDLARQLSSSWQQQVKTRGRTTFSDFVEGVTREGDIAHGFWIARDLPEILDRWSRVAPPERTHVVVSPQSGQPPELLLERFCSVLGISTEGLDTTASKGNETLGHPQAELLRRVNVALGDRLGDVRGDYRDVGRLWFANDVLARQRSRRPLVPAELRGFVEERTDSWLRLLQDGPYDVVGDLDEIRSRDESFAEPGAPSEPTDEEVLEAAAAALADVLEIRHEELQEAKRTGGTDVAPPSQEQVGLVKRLLGSLS